MVCHSEPTYNGRRVGHRRRDNGDGWGTVGGPHDKDKIKRLELNLCLRRKRTKENQLVWSNLERVSERTHISLLCSFYLFSHVRHMTNDSLTTDEIRFVKSLSTLISH